MYPTANRARPQRHAGKRGRDKRPLEILMQLLGLAMRDEQHEDIESEIRRTAAAVAKLKPCRRVVDDALWKRDAVDQDAGVCLIACAIGRPHEADDRVVLDNRRGSRQELTHVGPSVRGVARESSPRL